MATIYERLDSNDNRKKKEEHVESYKLHMSSIDGVQGDKPIKKINGSYHIGKTDILSSIQSINENNKFDHISNKSSDINIYKKNDETTQHKEESGFTSMSSNSIRSHNMKKEETKIASSSPNNNEDSKNDKSQSATSDSKKGNNIKMNGSTSKFTNSHSKNDNNAFSIEKDDAQHLTDFQLEKARFFFNVNLGRLFNNG